MLKEYSVSDILNVPSQHIPYYIGTFEGTEDTDIEWPHRHNFYSLVWFTEGTGFYVIDMVEYDIKPNRIFLVTPKQIHNWDYSENSKGYILICDATLALEINLSYVVPYLDIVENNFLLLKGIFTNLLTEIEHNDKFTYTNIKSGISYLHNLLQRPASHASQTSIKNIAEDSTINDLKQLVFENPHCIRVDEYAERMKVSEDKLNSICKNITGLSAKQYILDLKITEAKRSLIYTDENINEISFSLGFEDSSYFSRIFKKKALLSPSEFLKKYRKHS